MRSSFRQHRSGWHRAAGFSLLELLVSLVVVAIILVTALQFVSQVELTWKKASADPFAEAGNAFSIVAQHLGDATLAPYQDYADSAGAFRTADNAASFVPDQLARRSDLDFVCGPSVALLDSANRTTAGDAVFFVNAHGYTQIYAHKGMGRLLNARGYFVEFGDDDAPVYLLASAHRWRWRLREVRQPAESLQVYATGTSAAWITQLTQAGATTPVLAENVIALMVLPERAAKDTGTALASDFRYDSRDAAKPLTHHQLPPRLRLAMVAIDEASAQLLSQQQGTAAPVLVPNSYFQQADQLDTDLASLDANLTAQKIGHRIFQREIQVTSSAWSEISSPLK